MSKHVTIQGIRYKIIRRETPDEMARRGYLNSASALREAGAIAQYYLQRPKGHTGYFSIQYPDFYTKPLSLGKIA